MLRIPVRTSEQLQLSPSCTQQSVTIPPEAGAKFSQPLLYGSDEWHAVYSTIRNTNEGMNGFVKDGAHEALDDPRRRRLLGTAAQSVLVAFLLMAANVRKISSFLKGIARIEQGVLPRTSRRRRTRPLDTWRPPAPDVGPTPGPDPPVTV